MGDREAHPDGLAGRRVALVLGTSAGGVGTHVRLLAGALVRAGAGVAVLGPASTEELHDFTGTGASFAPVEIHNGPRPVADSTALIRLRALLRRADVVHAHGLRAGLLAGLATRHPLVVTWHNAVLAGGQLGRVYAALERVVARRADLVLAVSPDLEERVRTLGGRDVRPGPVAAPPLPRPGRTPVAVRAELGAADRPLLVTVARLHPQKGYRTLVEAAARLAGREPPPLFVAAGDGPQRAELDALIAEIGAPVKLLGRRSDVSDLLAAADVVVLPSVWEGSPLAAQEALRAGKPFIGTLVGGVPALVGDAGDLVPPEDPEALAAAVCRVLDDADHAAALVARGRARLGQLPTPDSVFDQVSAVYTELMGAG
jgi:glycosyltransferase involved in cell wall biosynthesis